MVKGQTELKTFLRGAVVVLAVIGMATACGPAPTGLSPEQVQVQVATGVAATVEAMNSMGTGVAMTVAAVQPAAAATLAPTDVPLFLPTLTPLATVTPFVVQSSGGGSGAKPATYSCSWTEVKPRTNVFSPGDAIDVKWIITNTGTKTWPSFKDFDFVSGTQMSTYTGQELPALKPGDQVTISFDANAPMEKGFYEMKFKVEGGLCFPALDVEVGKAKDP